MTFDIFQVDWITIDIIIIVLLIVLLISVKILKEIYRWRFFFSNTSTIRRVDNLRDISNQLSSISIKKCTLTNSSVFQQEDFTKPTIIIIRRNRKLMLLKALTEAFCTFGCNVISVRFKMLTTNRTKLMKSETEKEVNQTISAIIMFYNQKTHLVSQDYDVIDFSKIFLPLNILLKDYHSKKIILINPRLKLYNLEKYLTFISESSNNSNIITIFSGKLNPFFKNKNLKKKLLSNETFKNNKHAIIQNAKSTFKYYETLLLAIISRYIEKE
ncbi:MAG: hypothetical protein KGD74_11485 [Candidatus Lokiarchaeota archaeon]|nr:hypothetical protein [Candidatus Lokiarchaeota archaeon]